MRQNVALGVKRGGNFFEANRAPGKDIDLLPNQQLPALPPLRFRICIFSRGLEPLRAAIGAFKRRDFRRHRRRKPRNSLFGGIFCWKWFEGFLGTRQTDLTWAA
jgi:hypothetical protein